VRVEADPHVGGAEGGPECSILSPDFCGGETLAALVLVSVDSRGIEKDASSTLGYGRIIQLSEVPERSTAMRQARGADESCASLHSPRPQKGSFNPASAAVLQSRTVTHVDVQLRGAAELCGVRRKQLDSLALVDSRRNGGARFSSTPGYGSLIRLSEVLELSTP
jgi:hypothetical protein